MLPIALFLLLSGAPVKPDFSGSWALTASKSMWSAKDTTLQVTQTDAAVEVTTVVNGSEKTQKFLFAAKGPAIARIKKDVLILETLVDKPAQPNAPAVQVHTRQTWKLSSDRKTLTINTEVDAPALGGYQLAEPTVESYVRE